MVLEKDGDEWWKLEIFFTSKEESARLSFDVFY